MNSFYVANDTAVIFDSAIFTRETRKGRGVEYQKSSNRARPAQVPFFEQFTDRPAYDMVVNDRPARTLYFSQETRKEEGGGY
jgi:hypothetical protein